MSQQGGSPGAVHRQAPASLHSQVAESLFARVSELPTGSRLPSELELMEEYGVSRTTIRAAVSALVDRGVLVRRQGKGTFVRSDGPSITHSLDHLSPFFAVLSAAGHPPDTEILDFGWVGGLSVPVELGGPQAQALAYRRLYFDDGRPHALLHVHVAERYGRGIRRADVESTPIFHLLERKHDLVLRRARYTITSTIADAELAQHLQLDVGDPLLVMNRRTHSPTGNPVELTTHYLRADTYELTVNLDEPDPSQALSPLALSHRR